MKIAVIGSCAAAKQYILYREGDNDTYVIANPHRNIRGHKFDDYVDLGCPNMGRTLECVKQRLIVTLPRN